MMPPQELQIYYQPNLFLTTGLTLTVDHFMPLKTTRAHLHQSCWLIFKISW